MKFLQILNFKKNEEKLNEWEAGIPEEAVNKLK